MEERKPPVETYKNEEDYFMENEEEMPPDLAPPPPINPYRGNIPSFNRSDKFLNGTKRFTPYAASSYSSIDQYNEDVAMRFLIGNGRPFETINDPAFLQFLEHLNHTRPPPEPEHMTARAFIETRPDIKYQRTLGPLGVTIEAIRKSDEIFLSISAHCYNEHGERQNTVHFEKLIIADYEGKVVADRIRKVVDSKKAMNFAVSYIMSPNLRMLEMVTANMHVKNKFICFFSYITNIAREVLKIPEFEKGLIVLREYVSALQKHREVSTKFKTMQKNSNDPVDIPFLDVETDWMSTLHFLATCGRLNKTFSSIRETWCMPKYLDANEENAMANVFEFLMILRHVTRDVCGENSCISQVMHSMSVIHCSIKNCGIRSAREKMRKTFNKFYNGISKGKSGDFFTLASLLDPRYAYSTLIFSEENWGLIEQKLIETVGTTQKLNIDIQNELKHFQRLHENLPEFNEENTPETWWNGHRDELPMMYNLWITHSALPAVAIDGKQFFAKGGKFAHLFANLDEELHLKAMLLAQSSQNFIGRGSAVNTILRQISEESGFTRLEDEPDKEESQAEPEVKQEPIDEVQQEIKTEELHY